MDFDDNQQIQNSQNDEQIRNLYGDLKHQMQNMLTLKNYRQIISEQKKKQQKQKIEQIKKHKEMVPQQLQKQKCKADFMKHAAKIQFMKEKRQSIMHEIRVDAVRQRIEDFQNARQLHRQLPPVINGRRYPRPKKINLLTHREEKPPMALTQEQLSEQARKIKKIMKDLGQTLHKGQNSSCQICLEQIQQNNPQVFLLCFHSFHKFCIQQWFANKIVCPVCKSDVKQELQRAKEKQNERP